jgi:hypothetical protein
MWFSLCLQVDLLHSADKQNKTKQARKNDITPKINHSHRHGETEISDGKLESKVHVDFARAHVQQQ